MFRDLPTNRSSFLPFWPEKDFSVEKCLFSEDHGLVSLRVYIPRYVNPIGGAMQSSEVSVGEAIRVLVVDDTRIHTQLLAEALRRDRQLDVIAPSIRSRDLVETVKQQPIDVVILSSN